MGCRTCEKPKVNYRKGLWSPEEDEKLRGYLLRNGHGSWSSIPAKAGLQRNGKSCRLRWLNYLRPGLKHGYFSPQEVEMVVRLHSKLGNKWSQIARHLPGRTDNEVKNYFNSYLKKKVKVDGSDHFHASTSIAEPNQIQNPPTQLSEESNKQISLSGCSESIESSSEDSIQSMQHVVKNLTNQEMNQIPSPKFLFADWIAMDQVRRQQSQLHSDIEGLTCQWSSTSIAETNVPANDHFIHEFSNFNNPAEFPPFNHGEGTVPEGSMFDLLSLVESCSNFHVRHDVIF